MLHALFHARKTDDKDRENPKAMCDFETPYNWTVMPVIYCRIGSVKKFLTEAPISANIGYRKRCYRETTVCLVKCKSKKQPNFGQGGCFFDVFYFYWSAGY